MEIIGLGWLGTKTKHARELARFYGEVLGLPLTHHEEGFWISALPDGRNVEVFGEDHQGKEHFETGPVAGFAVENLPDAVAELQAAGIELLGTPGPDVAARPRPRRQRLRAGDEPR